MAPNWTTEQKNAIYAQGGSLLVSAAAGSGKTAVLVQRVIDRITNSDNPVSVDRLLVVTYTKAAAQEMKDRISAKLNELIAMHPSNTAYLKNQRLLLNRANISTVHSFCSNIIKEYFFELNISPDFKIGDENELKIIKSDALNEVLEFLYEEDTPNFKSLANCFNSSRDDKALQNIILKVYDFLKSLPFPYEWMEEKLSMYSVDGKLEDTKWCSYLMDYAVQATEFCADIVDKNLELCRSSDAINFTRDFLNGRDPKRITNLKTMPIMEIYEYYKVFFDDLREKLKERSWQELYLHIRSFDKCKLYSTKDFNTTQEYQSAKKSRDIVCDAMDELAKLFNQSEESCKNDIKLAYPIVSELFKAVQMFEKRFSELKNERAILDFSDLEHLTLKLLIERKDGKTVLTDNARAIASRFDEVMVDEYQDANEVQDTIFYAVSNEDRNLFTVGDVKQSIYRFRQACPDIFIKRSRIFPLYDPDKNEYPAKIVLDRNFRSRIEVLDAVNFVFRLLMSENVGEMEYTSLDELKKGASYADDGMHKVEYKLIEKGDSDDDMTFFEAKVIAERIHKFMAEETVSEKDGTLRKPRYSDFCILLRSSNKHGPVMARELENYGIPTSSDAKDSFFNCREINIIMSILRTVDNPLLDIPLLSAMMSPVYSFTPDELALIRAASPKENLYTAVRCYADKSEHVREFLESITYFRTLASATPVHKLINSIYQATSLEALVSTMKNGKTRAKNLKLLREYAAGYEQNGFKGLNAFIRFMDRMQENGNDISSATGEKASVDAVKIMSIHSSKGLEFPVCIIANLSRDFNSDANGGFLIHPQMGVGFTQNTSITECKYSTMMQKSVSKCISTGEKSEELRVLYVALTRAREKLILIQSETDVNKYIDSMAGRLTGDEIPPYIVSKAGSLGDWICMCALFNSGSQVLKNSINVELISKYRDGIEWDIEKIEFLEDDEEEVYTVPKQTRAQCNTKELDRLTHRLQARYTNSELTTMPVKFSVSEIAKNNAETFMPESRPRFMMESGLSGAEKGTALHAYMEFADFKKAAENPEVELSRILQGEFISPEQASAVDLTKIKRFFNSDICKRLLKSDVLYKEYKFTVFIDAKDAMGELSEYEGDEKVVLQGAIDCAFEENGNIIIVDYKTDKIKDEGELIVRYEKQLMLYKKALQECTNKKVTQMYLYSFWLDKEICVDCENNI